jgi:hypothetical protein
MSRSDNVTPLVAQLYRHDPFLYLLRDRLGLRDYWIVIAASLLTGIVIIGIPTLLHLLGYHTAEVTDALIPYDREWLATLIVIPLSFLTYLWFPSAIANLFNGLRDNGVIGPRRASLSGPDTYEDLVQKVVQWTNRYWWVVVWLIYGLAHVGWGLTHPSAGLDFYLPVRNHPQVWLRIVIHLVYLPARYTVLMSCMRLLVVLFYTRQLFCLFHVQIALLHPDGVAGFGVLRRLVTVGLLVAALLGSAATFMSIVLYFSHKALSEYPAIWILGGIYIIATPTVFLCWLWAPHRAMQEARDNMLQPLVDAFHRTLAESAMSAKENASTIKSEMDRLAEVKRQYDWLKNMAPTWPVQLRSLRGLIITSVLPLLSSLVPLVDFIVKILQKRNV